MRRRVEQLATYLRAASQTVAAWLESDERRRELKTRRIALAALAVAGATALASAAAGAPVAAKQRISIVVDGKAGTFVLSPLSAGSLVRDTGKVTDCCYGLKRITRSGQSINVNDPLSTFTGVRGRLVVRFRIEWVDAGNGYTVGNATWKVLRGTGAYAQLAGGGRSGHVWTPRGYVGVRAEGYVGP
jgi:hypothetical protein